MISSHSPASSWKETFELLRLVDHKNFLLLSIISIILKDLFVIRQTVIQPKQVINKILHEKDFMKFIRILFFEKLYQKVTFSNQGQKYHEILFAKCQLIFKTLEQKSLSSCHQLILICFRTCSEAVVQRCYQGKVL